VEEVVGVYFKAFSQNWRERTEKDLSQYSGPRLKPESPVRRPEPTRWVPRKVEFIVGENVRPPQFRLQHMILKISMTDF
jgi:hypothetical protein